MSPRSDPTKWTWCILVLSSGMTWSPVRSVAVHTPEESPSIIEAQAKFFQDFFSVQLSPYKIEFGHVCEDPHGWEQRYEKKDFKNHRDMGKVRWGDTNGAYGEHYWDLNHAGHTGNQENQEHDDDDNDYDDGPDHEELQDYSETIEPSNKYEGEEYDPKASLYKRSARPKRENSKREIQYWKGERNYEREQKPTNTEKMKNKRHLKNHAHFETEKTNQDVKHRHSREVHDEVNHKSRQVNNIKLITDQQDNYEGAVKAGIEGFVNYENGALRLYKRQIPAVARLFLESSTGHVINSATGQAYVLQPVN